MSTHRPISDPVLRDLAAWYPTNELARRAYERASQGVSDAATQQSRQAWEEDRANLRRLIELRGGSVTP